jgi:hypothetical protein
LNKYKDENISNENYKRETAKYETAYTTNIYFKITLENMLENYAIL